MDSKTFSCEKFDPSRDVLCTYTVNGEEDWVVEQAVDHLMHEHANEDTPQLREEIRTSLTNNA